MASQRPPNVRSALRPQPKSNRIHVSGLGKAGFSAALAPIFVADVGSAIAETVVGSEASADVASLLSDYPVLTSAAALLAVGGVAFAVASSGKPKSQATGAKEAFEALKSEERTVLVDLRPKSSLKAEGVIDLKETDKKVLSLVYAEADDDAGEELSADPEFAAKLQSLAGVSEASIVILIDSDGSLAPKAAATAAAAGFFAEKVYWVRDGVEGPRGWKANDLPTKPYRVFELPLPSLALPSVDVSALAAELQAQLPGVDLGAAADKVSGAVTTLTEKYKEDPTVANGVLAAAGIAAVGAFAITEFEAIIQVLGALGLARFVASNLLFAKDREATLAAVRAFLSDRRSDEVSGGASAASSSGGAGADAAYQQLQDIVMGAEDAESAAKQIADRMVPEMKGVSVEALAAALAASGVDLSVEPPPVEPVDVPAAPAEMAALEPITAAAVAEEAPVELAPTEALAEPAAVAEAPAEAAPAEAAPAEPILAEAVAPLARAGVLTPEMAPEPIVTEVVEATGVAAAAAAEVAVEEAAAASGVEPANVLEARAWIAAWKGRGAAAAAPQPVEGTEAELADTATALVSEDVLQARQWIAAWKAGQRQIHIQTPEVVEQVHVLAIGGDGVSESDPVVAVAEAVQVTANVPA